jgi:hypothetical protein
MRSPTTKAGYNGRLRYIRATTVKQTTRGTGAAAMKRQFVVRWESQGWAINFWIYDGQASSFGSMIFKGPEGAKSLSGIVIPFDNKTPEQVYAEIVKLLKSWIA